MNRHVVHQRHLDVSEACLLINFFFFTVPRLDSAENQVDETIFLLEAYINSTVRAVSPVKGK